MADNWTSYFCKVNDRLASIFLNLGLASDVPVVSKPWLLWVWLYFRTPRPDGLSDKSEADTLFKIEDALVQKVSGSCCAVHAGRITTEGRREFYFYGETKDGFGSAVKAVISEFKEYRFKTGTQHDPGWNQYRNVLHPSPDDLECIKNRAVLEILESEGDVRTAPHLVQHWIYFSAESDRSDFKLAAEQSGFHFEFANRVEGDREFVISVSRIEPTDEDSINATVVQLVHMAEAHRGEYDGWETQVITQ